MERIILTYMLPVLQSPTHSLEVLATELTHNVRRASFGSIVGSAFDPRSHAFDFVFDEGLPVFAVDVTPPAVEVSGVVKLVALHGLFVVEGLVTSFLVAWHCLDGLEWDGHLGEFEGGEVRELHLQESQDSQDSQELRKCAKGCESCNRHMLLWRSEAVSFNN